MMLTEKEAQSKWCLLARAGVVGGPLCVASACMSWRWAEDERELSYSCDGKLVDDGPKGDSRRGYCGFAGPVQFA
jgi:hypothetical protein